MKSPQPKQRFPQAQHHASQPSNKATGFASPLYGGLAAEIAGSEAAPLQGYGIVHPPLADEMASGDRQSAAPVQLRRYPHDTQASAADKNRYRAAFTAVETRINNEVDAARDLALNWNNYLDDDNARLARWASTAQQYFQDPANAPDFIHAQFGYAIEEIATAQLPANLNGLSIHLQVAAGHTRPDIVLRDGNFDVAWIDITAEESRDHILGKDGAGWKTRPFVSEILYDSLDLEEVLEGMNNPMLSEVGRYFSQKNQIVHTERERQTTALRDTLIALQEANGYTTGTGNAATKKNETREALEGAGMNLGRQAHIAAKGALNFVGINPGPFGYADGKSSTAVAKEFVNAEAQPEIQRLTAALNTRKVTNLRQRLNNQPASVSKTNYLAALRADEQANRDLSETIKVGIALDYAIDDQTEAANIALNLGHQHGGDARTAGVVAAINDHLDALPAHPTFANLRTWTNTLANLTFDAELLPDLIDKADDFEQYLYQYYGDNENPTPEEREILARLNDAPEDYTIIQLADRYMQDNPL
jgi:hypothetical protein